MEEKDMQSFLDEKDSINTEPSAPITNSALEDLKRLKESNFNLGIDKKFTPIGYVPMDIQNLPSKGRFYPINITISIRSALTKEIEHWSTMIENNPLDVDRHINDIINSCCIVKSGTRQMSYADLLEGDKIFILIAIKDRTFLESENVLNLTIPCRKCGHENKRELKNNIIDVNSECDEDLEKYYSEEHRCYIIKTKSYGEIAIHPPRAGVMEFILNYSIEREQKKKPWSKSLVTLLPFLTIDSKSLSDKKMIEWEAEMMTWGKDGKKYALLYRMCEKIKIGINPDIHIKCDNCSAEVTTPFDFPNGIKSLFLVSDFSDELI